MRSHANLIQLQIHSRCSIQRDVDDDANAGDAAAQSALMKTTSDFVVDDGMNEQEAAMVTMTIMRAKVESCSNRSTLILTQSKLMTMPMPMMTMTMKTDEHSWQPRPELAIDSVSPPPQLHWPLLPQLRMGKQSNLDLYSNCEMKRYGVGWSNGVAEVIDRVVVADDEGFDCDVDVTDFDVDDFDAGTISRHFEAAVAVDIVDVVVDVTEVQVR